MGAQSGLPEQWHPGDVARSPQHTHPTSSADPRHEYGDSAEIPVLLAFGSRDSHAIVLADGKTNGNPRAGQKYRGICWKGIVERARQPAAEDKVDAPFIIPSSYVGFDGRTHSIQGAFGQYWLLTVDLDGGNLPLEAVKAAVLAVVGDAEILVYSSSSATAEHRKWRVLVLLRDPVTGADFTETQRAFYKLLGAQGLICDDALSRCGQPVYLPNVPPAQRRADGSPIFYQYAHLNPGDPAALDDDHVIIRARERERVEQADAEAQRLAAAAVRRAERRDYVQATGDDFDPIKHFNDNHTIAELLVRFGFTKGKGDNWKSPLSTSGSFSMRDYGTHWVVVSSWAHTHNLGRETRTGQRSGDAFDLLAHFEHSGDKKAAARAYSAAVRPTRWSVVAPPVQPPSGIELGKWVGLPSRNEARVSLRQAVLNFFAVASAYQVGLGVLPKAPPFDLLVAGLGLGKTREAVQESVSRIRERRMAGDKRRAAVIAVPMHKLGDQIVHDVNEIAPELTVAVIRGVEANDPDAPGQKVCKLLPQFRDAQSLLLDTRKQVCKSCPAATDCKYLQGRAAVADIYLVAHGALVSLPPPNFRARNQILDHVLVDEDPTNSLVFGVNEPSQLAFAGWQTAPGSGQLKEFREKLAVAARENGPGPFQREVLLRHGLTATGAEAGRSGEWERKEEDPKKPEIEFNRTVKRAASIWKEVAHFLDTEQNQSGRLEVVQHPEAGLVIRHRGVRELHEGFKNAPTLMLDATSDPMIIEAVLGRKMSEISRVFADEPMLKLKQDPTRSGAKSMLISGVSPAAKMSATSWRKNIVAYLRGILRSITGTLLVIANKELIEKLRLEGLPLHVQSAHFGDLRGLNAYRDVEKLIVIGRWLPDVQHLNSMASAIFGDPVEGTLNKGPVERLVVSPNGIGYQTGETLVHTDHRAQAILQSIRDAEVMQAIGRVRAVNRSEPVEVTLLSDAVVDQPVEIVSLWAEIGAPHPIRRQIDAGGVAFESPKHAADAYPGLWKTREAAAKAFQRHPATAVHFSYKDLYEECTAVEVRYRIPRRQEKYVAWVDRAIQSDPVAAVQAALPSSRDVTIHQQPVAAAVEECATLLDVAQGAEGPLLPCAIAACATPAVAAAPTRAAGTPHQPNRDAPQDSRSLAGASSQPFWREDFGATVKKVFAAYYSLDADHPDAFA